MTDWSKLKVVDLRAELKQRGLQYSGLKQELVQRLADDDVAKGADDDAASETAQADTAAPSDNTNTDTNAADPPNDSKAGADVASPEPVPAATDAEEGNNENDETAPQPHREPASNITDSGTAPVASNGPDENVPAHASPEASPKATNSGDIAASDVLDGQKRKRPSSSPSPPPESKRVKADEDNMDRVHPTSPESPARDDQNDAGMERVERAQITGHAAPSTSPPPTRPAAVSDDQSTGHSDMPATAPGDIATGPAASTDNRPPGTQDEGAMDNERSVEPAVHPATRAVYIKNFMRPLRPDEVKARLVTAAIAPGSDPNEDPVELFHLDTIRTHAFVILKETSSAVRIRTALHDVTWPDESNRRPLWIDFVPPEKVQSWIDEEEEESRGSRRGNSKRWEVRYSHDNDGNVVAILDSDTVSTSTLNTRRPSRPHAAPTNMPSEPVHGSANSIPLGPRAGRLAGGLAPPLGPRNPSDARGPGPRASHSAVPGYSSGPVRTTRAGPPITYQTVSEDLARNRIDAIRFHYTKDLNRDLGREDEINRYTFESGDTFVDRGKEVFIGIRPPHREAERRRQLGGNGPPRRGPPPPPSRRARRRGPRGLSDRYLPGINESGPFRQGDRGNFSPRFKEGGRRNDPHGNDGRL